MAEMKTYTGGCHCGKVRYEVTTDLARVTACNCSICSKRNWRLTFVPEGQFKLLSGEGLTEYQFGKKHIHHHFCPVCGIQAYGTGKGKDGTTMFAIDARCLDGVDLSSVPVTEFDGRKL